MIEQRFESMRIMLMLFVVLALQACANANPIAQANTLELRAYAASGTYNIFQAKGLELIQTGNLPDNVSLRLIAAEERATPVVDSLDRALEEFESVRAEIADGTSSQEKYVIVAQRLNSWLERALPLIAGLKSAVKGAE